jgi:MFS family permease
MAKVSNKNYLLTILTVILAFNYLDRLALGLMFQDIKIDLQLSDTQLGFLGGIAFALFYAVMGIPIARWADRSNRVAIISLTAAIWSIAVALCGLANSFVQLLFIRIAVAIGEAGCTPPGFSLIASYFSRSERARAAAIYGLGGPISCLFGYFLAGWLNELYGWRMTFVLLGIPGIALALLAWVTLKDPWRQQQAIARQQSERAPRQISMKDVCVTLWSIVTFRSLLLCLSVMAFFTYGIFQWQPAFIMRTYGLTSGETGTWFAVTYGVGGIVGSWLGGDLASRYAARKERLQLQALTVTLLLAGVLSLGVYLAPTHQVAFVLMGLYALMLTTINGPLFAMIQSLVPEQTRAVSFAWVYLFMNLIGMGLGPLAAGALSDAFRPVVAEESLRYALIAMTPGFVFVAWYAWRAAGTVERDLQAAQNTRDTLGEESRGEGAMAAAFEPSVRTAGH